MHLFIEKLYPINNNNFKTSDKFYTNLILRALNTASTLF